MSDHKTKFPHTKFPLEAFGPELMAALLKGGRERFFVPFENISGISGSGKRRAHVFQRRINMLRKRMREADHPDYPLAARAKVSLFWGPPAAALDEKRFAHLAEDHNGHKGAIIVIQPHDIEFREVLTQAGMDQIVEPSPLEPQHIPSTPFVDSYDDILDAAPTEHLEPPEE